MDNNNNTDINVEKIMRMIQDEVARKKSEVTQFSSSDKFNHHRDDQELHPVIVREARLFRTIKIAQMFISKLPFYYVIHKKAVKLKKYIPRYREVLSMQSLYQYDDEAFISAAYRMILRREPDSHEYDYYLSRLQIGQLSKLEIIGKIRYSMEGLRSQTRIRGLFIRYALTIVMKIPLLGPLLRRLIAPTIYQK